MPVESKVEVNMNGYLYIASGDKYINQSIVSACSLRKVDKSANITLVTDRKIKDSIFSQIIVCPMDYSLIDKVRYIYDKSPYDKTFFLDVDTHFCENCNELFDLLNYFDVCMAAAPAENEIIVKKNPMVGYVPYNTGVIIFKKNKENKFLFEEWNRIFVERLKSGSCEKQINPKETDQASFGLALLNSTVKTYVLPNIWNARIPFFINLKGKVKIIHGWETNYEKIEKFINETSDQRCWDPYRRKCVYRRLSIIDSVFDKFFRK